MTDPITYKHKMVESLSKIIEETGAKDKNYTVEEKITDIYHVLEYLLAYTIYTTHDTAESMKESAKESQTNIEAQALHLLKANPK